MKTLVMIGEDKCSFQVIQVIHFTTLSSITIRRYFGIVAIKLEFEMTFLFRQILSL